MKCLINECRQNWIKIKIICISLEIGLTFSDSMTGYTDYVYNLDKLTVYVTSKPEEDTDSLQVIKKFMDNNQNGLAKI